MPGSSRVLKQICFGWRYFYFVFRARVCVCVCLCVCVWLFFRLWLWRRICFFTRKIQQCSKRLQPKKTTTKKHWSWGSIYCSSQMRWMYGLFTYIRSLGEKWPHSRGNVGKYSHPMEQVGFISDSKPELHLHGTKKQLPKTSDEQNTEMPHNFSSWWIQ